MNYEKKYKDALERARNAYQNIKPENTAVKKMLEEAFPELRESENERIRKGLVKMLSDIDGGYSFEKYRIFKKDALSWLEKQKEQKPANSYKPTYEQMEALRFAVNHLAKEHVSQSVRLSIMYDHLKETEEQKPVEWKPMPESLEALMYAIEGKWEMIKPTSYLSRRLEDLYEGLVNTFNVDESELRKLSEVAYTADDIEELKALKDKIEASMEQKPAPSN